MSVFGGNLNYIILFHVLLLDFLIENLTLKHFGEILKLFSNRLLATVYKFSTG